tara:strand:+ start:59 stop:541 length:483 start_codon:yes stop_codon:yes gene_type:complete
MRKLTHKHHIIPRHAGGSNDSSNIVRLTTEQHAETHKKLFFIYGRWQDEIAYLALSGQIGREEAIRRASREANIGKKFSEKTKRKLSEVAKGKKRGPYKRPFKKRSDTGVKRGPQSKEHLENRMKAMKGVPKPPRTKEHIEKHKKAMTGKTWTCKKKMEK